MSLIWGRLRAWRLGGSEYRCTGKEASTDARAPVEEQAWFLAATPEQRSFAAVVVMRAAGVGVVCVLRGTGEFAVITYPSLTLQDLTDAGGRPGRLCHRAHKA